MSGIQLRWSPSGVVNKVWKEQFYWHYLVLSFERENTLLLFLFLPLFKSNSLSVLISKVLWQSPLLMKSVKYLRLEITSYASPQPQWPSQCLTHSLVLNKWLLHWIRGIPSDQGVSMALLGLPKSSRLVHNRNVWQQQGPAVTQHLLHAKMTQCSPRTNLEGRYANPPH